MKTNVQTKTPPSFTHEGGRAANINDEMALRRSVLACMLGENEFYESGQLIRDRIIDLSSRIAPEKIAAIAIEARHEQNLRHAPLLLLLALLKRGSGPMVGDTIGRVVSRADEPGELISMYWKTPGNRKMLPEQLKRGLRIAFARFDEYRLAKYGGNHLPVAGVVSLKDAIRLCHPKPKGEEQSALWKRLINMKLAPADTWESATADGKVDKATWERLIGEGKLGYFALLRNLVFMLAAGVDIVTIRTAILARGHGADKVLPFRFVAAARAAPQLEPEIDAAMCEVIASSAALPGKTVVLVDVSRSMDAPLSSKSDMKRVDAAAALASLINGDVRMFSFSDAIKEVPPRRGMAGVDAIIRSQTHNGTRLFDAVAELNGKVTYDRLIVITDEQTEGFSNYTYGGIQGTLRSLPAPNGKGYMINVASAKNGVGYGSWVHLDGWSDSVIRFIVEAERAELV